MTILPRLRSAADLDFTKWESTHSKIILTPQAQSTINAIGSHAQAFVNEPGIDMISELTEGQKNYGLLIAKVSEASVSIIEAANFSDLNQIRSRLSKVIAKQRGELTVIYLEPRQRRPEISPNPDDRHTDAVALQEGTLLAA